MDSSLARIWKLSTDQDPTLQHQSVVCHQPFISTHLRSKLVVTSVKSFFCDSVWFLPMEKLSIITRSCNTPAPVLVSALSGTNTHLDGTGSSGPHQTVLKILDDEALLTNSKFSECLKMHRHIININHGCSNKQYHTFKLPINCNGSNFVTWFDSRDFKRP